MIHKYKLNTIFFTLLLMSTVSLAESDDAAKPSQDDAVGQLREIEHQLDIQAVELEQQKIHAKKLEKQMQCNWILLKAYEHCEEEHKSKAGKDRLKCNTDAKQDHKQCLARN